MNSYVFDKLPCGCEITAYEIGNDTVRATILNYGGIIQKLYYKGTDIIGGYDTLEGYQVSDGYQGALIGRYANRIRGGRFTLNGVDYQLAQNEDKNAIFENWCDFLNYFDSSVKFQLSFVNLTLLVYNLLPIYPLDGGMIMHNLIHSPRVMHIVSMAVAVLLIAGCLCMGYHAMLCILVILILLNYHGMKNAPY